MSIKPEDFQYHHISALGGHKAEDYIGPFFFILMENSSDCIRIKNTIATRTTQCMGVC